MNIISHRGFWNHPDEKNTLSAFARTIAARFGTETDVRDFNGRLVVSHDPPVAPVLEWDELVRLFAGKGLPLAVNVKADGLIALLAQSLREQNVDWFAFDMSGPQTLLFARAGLPFYTRHSEIEKVPILYEPARGIWLDSFENTWFDLDDIAVHHRAGKAICVVSAELHGRDPVEMWKMLRTVPREWNVTLCTDVPTVALEYFAK